MKGYRTILAMGLALVVALWQYYHGPLPVIDPALWDIVVPLAAIVLRFITTKPVGG